MQRVAVEAQDDFLERLSARGRPAASLAELIWNGLDADAHIVAVTLRPTLLQVCESISVTDDGHGMTPPEAAEGFAHLGGSWKRNRETTRGESRLLHGKDGKGRFRAFGLGANVTWKSTSTVEGKNHVIVVSGRVDDLKHFDISDPEATEANTGTTVEIVNVWEDLPSLFDERVREELSEGFAPYLRQYPHVRILYDETALDPRASEDLVVTYPLGTVALDDGTVDDGQLMIIEWTHPTSRSLYLCDNDGFAISRLAPQIHAPGFHFTAYLRSTYLREKADSLSLGEIHPGVATLIAGAKDILRDHFRRRSADQYRDTVALWRASDIYPYEGQPKSAVEEAERQVFDVVAYNVASYLPSFVDAAKQNQQLSFRLLKQAIEENPESLRRILSDVLRLPKERQDELAELLDRTSLSAIITAAKEVADRLDFLRGLELLVFEPTSRKQLLERKQLHRILAPATWLFGEDMRLAVDDQSLTEVLRRHLETLRRQTVETLSDNVSNETLAPVLREGGSIGIVDLMLSRRIPQPRAEVREHLIVELKRPIQAINSAVAQQVRSYAFAVQNDERFRDTNTRWTFWALSNRITDQVRWEMEDGDKGVLKTAGNLTILIKTWGAVIDECRARLTFFQERLQYIPSDEDAMQFLREVHEKYVPATPDPEAPSSMSAPEDLAHGAG